MKGLKKYTLLGLLFTSSAFAYSPADEAQIQKDIALMNRYTKAGDMVKLFEMSPPKVSQYIIQKSGKSAKEIKAVFANMGKMMADKKIAILLMLKTAKSPKPKTVWNMWS